MANAGRRSTMAVILGLSLLSLLLLLSACSSKTCDKNQEISNLSTLEIDHSRELKAPPGMILPTRNPYFCIPYMPITVGQHYKQVDLKPPVQTSIKGQHYDAQISGNVGTLIIKDSSGATWSQVVHILQKAKFTTLYRQDARKILFTDWVQWAPLHDYKEHIYSGRYQVSIKNHGIDQQIKVTLINLRRKNKVVNSPVQIQYYTAKMCNYIAQKLNTMIDQNHMDPVIPNRYKRNIHIYSSTNDAGLPNIILCASFEHVWRWLPDILKILSMDLKESNYSHGSFKVKYNSLSRKTIHKLGVSDMNLKNGYYKIQVGDLGPYSSLQFFDPSGRLLNRLQHENMLAVLNRIVTKK
ncbi:Outer membrane protein assembly factor BamC [Candidatus Erwinia haradaeae]|uniref:Outer membrane protein assembly factor BamC n=1 Tax=Candidatus Erwinia haradaeae TaxID=1922217 RepID=A0A451DIU1_9GAMM|nr:outer membrane protein assembly factor BamC [Candidatus Erwinia haradaeae]VFP86609.1 Outer membrane protein assembly factor BamC [Candidatus Erwinia haradaeae]